MYIYLYICKESNGLRDLDVGGFIAWHASEQKWAVLKTYTVWRETEESLRELAQAAASCRVPAAAREFTIQLRSTTAQVQKYKYNSTTEEYNSVLGLGPRLVR